jgi:hypothetical protein
VENGDGDLRLRLDDSAKDEMQILQERLMFLWKSYR